MKKTLIATVALFTTGIFLSAAYAAGAIPDFEPDDCGITYNEEGIVTYCMSIEPYPEAWSDIIPQREDYDDIAQYVEAINAFKTDVAEEEPRSIDEIILNLAEEQEIITEPIKLTQEEIKLVKQGQEAKEELDECYRGIGAWAALQGKEKLEHYQNVTSYELGYRDNLNTVPQVLAILLEVEECKGMKLALERNVIGAEEFNRYEADKRGEDRFGRDEKGVPATLGTDGRKLLHTVAESVAASEINMTMAEKLLQQQVIAGKTIDNSVWLGQAFAKSGFNYEDFKHEFPAIRIECETQYGVEQCPVSALDKYKAEEINNLKLIKDLELEKATKDLCERTWSLASSLTENRWPDILTDGTCDEYIDELGDKS